MSSMQNETDEFRRQMELTGQSYTQWEIEAAHLLEAADASTRTGFADRNHLDLALDIELAITEEIEMIDDVSTMSDSDTGSQLIRIRARLAALKERIHQAARAFGAFVSR